jgi:hypothetical protein
MTGVFETQTFQVCPTEPIIGIKRVSAETPNLLTQTSLNSDIPRFHPNLNFHSKGKVQQ